MIVTLRKIRNINWLLLLLFTIALFYIGLVIIQLRDSNSPIHYGGDYLAFWSAGKIADELGYTRIFDLDLLRTIQSRELQNLGFLANIEDSKFLTLPAPYLPIFIIPFQFLSRINLEISYWFWNLLNIGTFVGYLLFLIKKLGNKRISPINILLSLLSFPTFANLLNGQLNIFLLVCCGEFIRNAMAKKPVITGIWLAGFLLKPQLLILIIPLLLILRYWKVVCGFVGFSGLIIMISIFLSGVPGVSSLVAMWTTWGENNAVTASWSMINWRMVGVNLNLLTNSSIGWFATGFGIVLMCTLRIHS